MTNVFETPHSPLRRGADNGLRLGLYLTVLYGCMVGSARWPGLSLLFLALAVGVPFFAYMLLRGDYRHADGLHNMAAVWLNGLVMFVGGALLSSMILYVYLRWIDPGYLPGQWDLLVEGLREAPDAEVRAFSEQCRRAAENGFSISPIIFAMSLVWMCAFGGTVTSLVLALIITMRRPSRRVNK